MFSYEKRIKAVKLLLQYDMSYATVIRELGYPSRQALRRWHQEYKKFGSLHVNFNKQYKFTAAEKQKAVEYYLKHGTYITYS